MYFTNSYNLMLLDCFINYFVAYNLDLNILCLLQLNYGLTNI